MVLLKRLSSVRMASFMSARESGEALGDARDVLIAPISKANRSAEVLRERLLDQNTADRSVCLWLEAIRA
jgi:hypothetical protein